MIWNMVEFKVTNPVGKHKDSFVLLGNTCSGYDQTSGQSLGNRPTFDENIAIYGLVPKEVGSLAWGSVTQ